MVVSDFGRGSQGSQQGHCIQVYREMSLRSSSGLCMRQVVVSVAGKRTN